MTTEEKLLKIIGIPAQIKQATIDNRTINYLTTGQGPALLLIHGANFGWGVWYPNLAALAENFTVYAIDLPGAGRSSRIDYSKMDAEKDLLQTAEKFVEQLELPEFHVLGCSIGGWIALQLALRHPQKVKKIVLENSVGLADYMNASDKVIGFYPFARLIAHLAINPKSRESVEKFLRGIFYDRNINLPREFLDYFNETMQTSHNLLFISRLTALHKKLNMEPQLQVIRNSTLVIWGAEDKIIPLDRNLKNFSRLPNVQVKLISQAGHIPSLEKPEEFNRLVNQFLI